MSLGRVLLLASAIAVTASVAAMGARTQRAQLGPDAEDEPVVVEPLPIRAELAQRVQAQPSTPASPFGRELQAASSEKRPPDAVVPTEPVPRSRSYRQYGIGGAYPSVDDPNRPGRWVTDTKASSTRVVKGQAVPGNSSMTALCAVTDSTSDALRTCSAIDLFSKRGYLVRPGTHVGLAVAADRVNLMVRFATF